ncbi:MAG TPA: C-20 methyltransferase BchU [Chloroflexia bacterium]|nr:C-20 methyltransferase BchU [Chloroflexia bacterium]
MTDVKQVAGTEPAMSESELLEATDLAYNMVFKSTTDFFCLKAAADLGLFEIMGSSAHSLENLAGATGSVPARLEKFLLTLRQIGLVTQHGVEWELTPLSRQFFANPAERRNLTLQPFLEYLSGMIENYYLRLADVVRGQVNFTSLIPYPPRTREDSIFYETLHRSNTHYPAKLLCEHAALHSSRRLLDVGGGIGDIAAELCQAFPQLEVTLINLPSAINLVNENVAAKGLDGRITTLALDMYREAYPQTDVVLFSRILYPLNPGLCSMLIQRAYDALIPGGRIVILDMNISDPAKPNYDYLTHYLSGIGMDFSILDFKSHEVYPALLQKAGFGEVQFNAAYDHVLYQATKPVSAGSEN